MKTFIALSIVSGLVLAGCAGKPSSADEAACPPKVVAIAVDNQAFLTNDVVVGETSAKALKKRKGLYRNATLERGADVLTVPFLLTGLRKCSWMSSWDSLTPVVVKDGVIVGYGDGTVQDLIAQGWSFREATWPWQSYHFGYLPKK